MLTLMEHLKRVKILPNGQHIGGTRIVIEEDEDLDTFIDRASNLLWKGKKHGIRLFFDDGMEVFELKSIIPGDTLYISDGADWIGILLFRCFR